MILPEVPEVQDAAKETLRMFMKALSQDHYHAGWLLGCEFDLWERPAGGYWGGEIFTERKSMLLRLLSEECDGWWRWEDGKGTVFVPLDEWREIVAARMKEKL